LLGAEAGSVGFARFGSVVKIHEATTPCLCQ
jgi:hypothetical protein